MLKFGKRYRTHTLARDELIHSEPRKVQVERQWIGEVQSVCNIMKPPLLGQNSCQRLRSLCQGGRMLTGLSSNSLTLR